MKTKILAIALTLAALATVEASAGAIYGANGAIVGYNHMGTNTMMGANTMMPGVNWQYDCRFNYYVPSYY